MITERLSFRAKYGEGDGLVQLMKDSMSIMPMGAVQSARLYTDLTGPMFSVILEIDHADMDAYAASTKGDSEDYARSEFQEWFAKMAAITEGGDRQLLHSERLK